MPKLPEPPYRYRARVIRVHDGDTVIVDLDLGWRTWRRDEPVRLLGINAPELKTPAGPGAADFLEGLIENYGELYERYRHVILESRRDRHDKYGRMLGRLLGVRPDGSEICLNDEMLSAGYAQPMDG